MNPGFQAIALKFQGCITANRLKNSLKIKPKIKKKVQNKIFKILDTKIAVNVDTASVAATTVTPGVYIQPPVIGMPDSLKAILKTYECSFSDSGQPYWTTGERVNTEAVINQVLIFSDPQIDANALEYLTGGWTRV